MASIEIQTNNGVDTYWVRWREPGAKKKSNEPFTGDDAQLRAERFKIDVQLAGGRWPKLWWPRIGYVTQAQWDAYEKLARGEAEQPAPAPTTPLLPYLRARIALLGKITAGTRAENLRLIARYFDPYEPFQAADVRDAASLNADTVAAWVAWMSGGVRDPDDDKLWLRTPKKPKTVHNAHGLLFQLLDKAVRGEEPLRRTNPCEGTDLPKLDDATEEENTYLSRREFELLHAAGAGIGRDMALFAVATGMRFSEIAALHVGDVVAAGPSPAVWVRRAWKRDPAADEGRVVGPPKSAAGRRRVALDEVTLQMLDGYLPGRTKTQYLFTDAHGKPFTHARFYRGHWQPMLYRAIRCEQHRALDRQEGIEVKGKRVRMTSKRELSLAWLVPCGCPGTLTQVPRFHDLRHTWVSWLIAAGVPIVKIARAAGHDDVKTTYKVYGHLLPELDDQQAEAIGSALSGLLPPALGPVSADGEDDGDGPGGAVPVAA